MRNLLVSLLLTIVVTVPAAARTSPESGVTPAAALAELKGGNSRFARGKSKNEDRDEVARRKLVEGQHPVAIVLSCSDSRVPPEVVFDEGLGRLFTVRVAGNILEPDTVASIEYAVEHLGARLIVVMGHESCGAVKAALATPPNESAGSSDLDKLLGEIRTNIGGKFKQKSPEKANVNAVANELVIHSKIIGEKVRAGQVAVAPALYRLESGLVEFW